MEKCIIIGAGISGISIAQCLKNRFQVKLFEAASKPGGLIKCERINGHLYHTVGGHVFNTKRQDVLEWFWGFFKKEEEFSKATRNSTISMADGSLIPYPIENHAYLFGESMMKDFINDLISMASRKQHAPTNFEEFLQNQFGETLYRAYFQPYNEKIWRRDLNSVPLSWLEGKLPMPSLEEILYNNFVHIKEKSFVHSTFYYEKYGGSQFLADRLAKGLDIQYNTTVTSIHRTEEGKWTVNGELCDKVIFCGNIIDIPNMVDGLDISEFTAGINALEAHGTTSVLCEIADNPYSWIYMPSRAHKAHRIICTGNFAQSNNAKGKLSATIEFTDYISKDEIEANLKKIPFSPKYITHKYTEYTYPIQNISTRKMLDSLKQSTEPQGLYFLGRFAEWEYYNMDAAMGAALDLNKRI
ncbi:protoporphyrinogen/coproporphyrinogen oxidase [Alistipes sp.]|mgnify:CR=1 FL=1|uniref:protoporphyrinogen/coproporphyrinogen oxidase n=1 Tax=Alistipes sp. TaxID=1872444 RepID=UPI003AB2BE20